MSKIDTALESLEAQRALLLEAKRLSDAAEWLKVYGPTLSQANLSFEAKTSAGIDAPGRAEALRLLAETIISQGSVLIPMAIQKATLKIQEIIP